MLPEGRSLPGDKLLYAVNDRLGENLFSMGLVRAAARVARGWHQDQVQAAGRRAVAALSEIVAPFAPQRLAAFRAEGHRLVLSTTTPVDMIAPFAEAFGFDDLIATAYETKDGRYTGRLYEGFVWGTGKLRAVRRLGRRQPDRPGRLPRLQRQHLRRPAALERGHAPRGQPRSLADRRRHRPPLAGRALGPSAGRPERHRARAVPPAAPVRPQALLPLRPLRHRRRRARAARAGRCCWPPTTAATSTWPRWRSWPAPSGARCASSARRRSSTRPSSGRSPAPSAASPSTAAADRASPCGPPRPR